ncbi:MAG: cadherin repeat domain-containing protein, partial [Acidobacteria bacterium]|nr:cadherin repeat domain-containing protein [Acidobacteriota bacterium]
MRTTDQGSLSFEETFTITVNNLNEAPTDITVTPSSIEENNTAGDTVGTLAATDPDAGDTHIFTLVAGAGATDNASFTIDGDSLKLNVSADFETKSSYSLRVRAEDGDGATFEKVLTVTITDVDEAPTALDLSATSLDENVAANTTVGTLSTTDPDAAATHAYTLVAGAGDTDNARFNVSGSALRISASPDFETKSSYSVRVRTTDQGSLSFEETFTITVNNLNEAPTNVTLTPSSIGENNTAGDTVGTLAASDPDAGDTHTFTLVAGTGDTDNAEFSIVGTSLKISDSADFETKSSYSLRVQAEDADGATFEKALTVTITNANEAPTALDLSVTSIDENVAANSTVGTLSTTDPDAAATHTYTLVAGAGDTDNASFNVSGSALRISASPDFETKDSYEVRVRTTDQGSLFLEEIFTITVNNLNEAPTNITVTPSSIEENNTAGDTVGTLAATDPEAGDTHTFTLVAGTGATDNGSFTIVGDSLQIDVSADFETKSSYSLRVQAEDGDGATFEKALTVTITDVDEAPTALDLSATSLNENVAANTTVGTLSTTDPDAAATHAYTLVAGAGDTDNASFNVSGSALRISASPDFETKSSYSVRVRTTDQANGSLFFEETFTITINDGNDAPAISGGPVALPAVYDYEPATVVALADVLTDATVTYLDQDATADAGVAVVGAAGAGLWEYSANGVSWTAIGAVGNASALLLPDSYSLRYTADYPGPDGGETASLTLRAWDQTSGTAGTLANATTQGGSSAFSTGTLLLSLQVQEDDRAPTVTDVEINEVSDYAVFEVTAVAEQRLLLSLGQDADPATANATVTGFTLETLNPAGTAWVAHDPADTIEVPAGGTLLVRVGTATEQDDAFEGSEVFTLVAEALSGASNPGTGTIRDDDEGSVFLASNLTATANVPTHPDYPVLDDDVVKFIEWGEAGSLAEDSRMDATLATADAVY